MGHNPPRYRPSRRGFDASCDARGDPHVRGLRHRRPLRATQFAALDPIAATDAGIAGHDHELTDFSPAGAARARPSSTATRSPRSTTRRTDTDDDRIAAAVMPERLQLAVDLHDAGERAARRCASSAARCRRSGSCFDLMALRHRRRLGDRRARAWRACPTRSRASRPRCARASRSGVVAARRQALACAEQAATWGGDAKPPFFRNARRAPSRRRARSPTRGRRGDRRRTRGSRAFLRDEYAPAADPRDPVGRERYALFAARVQRHRARPRRDVRVGLGGAVPHRGRDARASPSASCPARRSPRSIDHLDHDPTRTIEGVDEFQRWNQELIDRTIAELNGTHFDIAEPLHRCEAMIAPPGGAAAMYYTGPSEDFSRPGRTWYPTHGQDDASRCGAR